MRHEAIMSAEAGDGASTRAHIIQAERLAARKGSPDAQEDIDGPEPPEGMDYLVQWAYALYGRSGVSMDGLAPLSYGTVDAWSRLTDTEVTPLEIRALMELDAVIRHPEQEDTEQEPEERPPETPWPTKD